ncbi:MAG: precorrin-6y C5,15-methyltransferase (decarboxylating) subunit CbiE [Alphaproteobacteria bacterium]|nr:precorrin-6y C5,15-methyltransferase (decarboxylating) subunit CbiE [Alphaproteobacteria bacterium]MCB9931764.1 precorrin-6y C5,15-methyltransferase (decarboxylating) subunit CbiE [Alphaproteobacteria bacterium]
MAEAPWLAIIGLGEDGAEGLLPASRTALEHADLVAGAARHLALLPDLRAERMEWPVPFDAGIKRLLAARGRKVVMLASGDPFWFGAGSVLARHLRPGEWRALPGPSTFSLAAARLGWPLERTVCLGLHAAPLSRLRPHLAPGQRLIVLVRDGPAVAGLANYLAGLGFGRTVLHVLEALGGPRERVRKVPAAAFGLGDVAHPVAVALEVAGAGEALPCVSGLADDFFAHDGQISKRPVRALALSALAPRPGERLWDIGAGSGSIGIEWLLAHPANRAVAFEADAARAKRAAANAAALGVDRLEVVVGTAPACLEGRKPPDAVFVGGGLSQGLLNRLWALLPPGVRLVAHAVTLESEALLATSQSVRGGSLLRLELAETAALGRKRAWKSAYPIVQWSVVR